MARRRAARSLAKLNRLRPARTLYLERLAGKAGSVGRCVVELSCFHTTAPCRARHSRNTLANIPNAPGYRMGTSSRDGSKSARGAVTGPAPDAYSPIVTGRSDSRRPAAPAYSFGSMKRSATAPQKVGPGPGAHASLLWHTGRCTLTTHTHPHTHVAIA